MSEDPPSRDRTGSEVVSPFPSLVESRQRLTPARPEAPAIGDAAMDDSAEIAAPNEAPAPPATGPDADDEPRTLMSRLRRKRAPKNEVPETPPADLTPARRPVPAPDRQTEPDPTPGDPPAATPGPASPDPGPAAAGPVSPAVTAIAASGPDAIASPGYARAIPVQATGSTRETTRTTGEPAGSTREASAPPDRSETTAPESPRQSASDVAVAKRVFRGPKAAQSDAGEWNSLVRAPWVEEHASSPSWKPSSPPRPLLPPDDVDEPEPARPLWPIVALLGTPILIVAAVVAWLW